MVTIPSAWHLGNQLNEERSIKDMVNDDHLEYDENVDQVVEDSAT